MSKHSPHTVHVIQGSLSPYGSHPVGTPSLGLSSLMFTCCDSLSGATATLVLRAAHQEKGAERFRQGFFYAGHASSEDH